MEPAQAPDVEQLTGGDPPKKAGRKIPLWLAVLAMIAALVFAVLILARVAGPLYGLIFPVDPPVPDNAEETEHVKPDKGAEYWIYRTEMPGEDVAAFYEDEGGQCWYTDYGSSRPEGTPYSVARCSGQHEAGGLEVSWEVYIFSGYSKQEGPTVFRVYKYGEVN